MGGRLVFGGVAQLVRACGSYPQCPEFESLHRHHSDRTPFQHRKGVLRFQHGCCHIATGNEPAWSHIHVFAEPVS